MAEARCHAEAEALIKAKDALGTLPTTMTMYVDRVTCNRCITFLPYLLKYYGVKQLFIYWRNGTNMPRLITAMP
jgi:hypothetical protein